MRRSKYCKNNNSNESIEIVEDNSEVDILDQLAKEVADTDPDFILTDDGDSFTFPYLIENILMDNIITLSFKLVNIGVDFNNIINIFIIYIIIGLSIINTYLI